MTKSPGMQLHAPGVYLLLFIFPIPSKIAQCHFFSSLSNHRQDEGGCPCSPGEVKCGESRFSSGFCTTLCCDWETEETCYDSSLDPVSCKKYTDGPCPTFTSLHQ